MYGAIWKLGSLSYFYVTIACEETIKRVPKPEIVERIIEATHSKHDFLPQPPAESYASSSLY